MEYAKLEKIRNADRSKTNNQVRSFLGLAGYYWIFIPAYSDDAAPLMNLTMMGCLSHVD